MAMGKKFNLQNVYWQVNSDKDLEYKNDLP